MGKKQENNLSHFLNHVLADTYVLYLKTQNLHWNIKGPHFYAYHKMLQEQYEELEAQIDTIAERIQMIQGVACGSMQQFLSFTQLKEVTDPLETHEFLAHLLQDHKQLARVLPNIIHKAQANQDEGTADMLIQLLRVHEKFAWMLASTIH